MVGVVFFQKKTFTFFIKCLLLYYSFFKRKNKSPMKQVILIVSFLFLTINLTAQTQFPKFSIGTDLSSKLEYQSAVWLNSQYFIAIDKDKEYSSILLDVGYIVGESKIYKKSLDRNKVSFKLRAGTNFYTQRKDKFWTYYGLLVTFKSTHFSKVGDFVEDWHPWNGETINNDMLREANMTQISLQYTNGFKYFISKHFSIDASWHLGIKSKHFKLTRGVETVYPILQGPWTIAPFKELNENFKTKITGGIDIDLALKLNYLLY
jgi:hypothetical protein